MKTLLNIVSLLAIWAGSCVVLGITMRIASFFFMFGWGML